MGVSAADTTVADVFRHRSTREYRRDYIRFLDTVGGYDPLFTFAKVVCVQRLDAFVVTDATGVCECPTHFSISWCRLVSSYSEPSRQCFVVLVTADPSSHRLVVSFRQYRAVSSYLSDSVKPSRQPEPTPQLIPAVSRLTSAREVSAGVPCEPPNERTIGWIRLHRPDKIQSIGQDSSDRTGEHPPTAPTFRTDALRGRNIRDGTPDRRFVRTGCKPSPPDAGRRDTSATIPPPFMC